MPRLSPEKKRIYQKLKHRRNRRKVLDFLGGYCVKCGISDYDVLQIDHIIPIKKSSKERKPLTQLIFHILNGKEDKNNFQILCANCHMKKTVMESRKNE